MHIKKFQQPVGFCQCANENVHHNDDDDDGTGVLATHLQYSYPTHKSIGDDNDDYDDNVNEAVAVAVVKLPNQMSVLKTSLSSLNEICNDERSREREKVVDLFKRN